MRVWIDIANAPHVRLFAPVVEELQARGDEIVLTARNHRETAVLARTVWPEIEVGGDSSPDGVLAKGRAIASRASTLARFARRTRPHVALGHNSYAQIVAARVARVPVVTAMDYEHQPANHLAFRLADRVIVPEVFPADALQRFGARPAKVRRYRGVKEELYVAAAPEEDGIRGALGLPSDAAVVVLRLPPDGALYHRDGNDLVDEAVAAARREGAVVVVLARSEEQRQAWRRRQEPAVVVPDPPVDTPALLAAASSFVGAGGTMTREAAVLGVRAFSIFAGRPSAVDAWLEREGRLTVVREPGQLVGLAERGHVLRPLAGSQPGLLDVVLATLDEVRR